MGLKMSFKPGLKETSLYQGSHRCTLLCELTKYLTIQ